MFAAPAGQRRPGLADGADRALWLPDAAYPSPAEEREHGRGEHHQDEDDAESGPLRQPDGQYLSYRDEQEEQAEEQDRKGDDEEDAALDPLALDALDG